MWSARMKISVKFNEFQPLIKKKDEIQNLFRHHLVIRKSNPIEKTSGRYIK